MRYNVGLLYTPSHGYAGFTVPHFDRFMLRAVPQLDVPARSNRDERIRTSKPWSADGDNPRKRVGPCPPHVYPTETMKTADMSRTLLRAEIR